MLLRGLIVEEPLHTIQRTRAPPGAPEPAPLRRPLLEVVAKAADTLWKSCRVTDYGACSSILHLIISV